MAASIRYTCYVPGCDVSVKASTSFGKSISELSRHFKKRVHGEEKFDHGKACTFNESKLRSLIEALPNRDMEAAESSAGRPQREKKPTEKVKVATKAPQKTDDKEYVIPPKYVMPALDLKWSQEPKEITKIYDHTKTSKITGEMTKIAAQVPALFEALSGMNLHDLMANVKAMKPMADGEAKPSN